MFRDMENVKKYNVIFIEVFSVGEEVLNDEFKQGMLRIGIQYIN